MKKETKEVTVVSDNVPVARGEGLLLSTMAFEHGQRVALMLSKSKMVPDLFKNSVGDCMIALNFANRSGLDPIMIMQKMFVIHGKPSIEAQLQIALLTASGRFTPLRYKLTGEGDTRACVVIATENATGEELEGPEVSIRMAKDEGWHGKAGSKWKTLPELMLRYRAASFFIRLYSPETLMGFISKEEAEDIVPIAQPIENGKLIDIDPPKEPKKKAPAKTPKKSEEKTIKKPAKKVEAEPTVKPEPETENPY